MEQGNRGVPVETTSPPLPRPPPTFPVCFRFSAAIGDPVTVSNKDIEIYSGAFAIALVVFICTVAAGRWRLDRRSGSFLIALYVVFLSLSILRTMGLL